MRIGILHYAGPPVIGGVERVIGEHARLFAEQGHEVVCVVGKGSGEAMTDGVDLIEIPELFPQSEQATALAAELQRGRPGCLFDRQRAFFLEQFQALTEDVDLLIVHNVFTMPFQLAATAALWDLAGESECRIVSWVHDLAATNPDYDVPQRPGSWDLLRGVPPEVEVVAISELRREQILAQTGIEESRCRVIANGIDSVAALGLSPGVGDFVRRHDLLGRDVILFQPTRILRRKNIEMGIRVTATMRDAGQRVVYLVTGAPDPHQAGDGYGEELRELVTRLDLEQEVFFLGEHFSVGNDDLPSLYNVADALFFPSHQEGFGLPLIEAGMVRLPIFCSAIEPLRSVIGDGLVLFDLEDAPESVAALVTRILADDRGFLARKETLARYAWGRLYAEKLQLLLVGE